MRQRNNMSVVIAAIDSRIKTKRNAIRIHFTYGDIHGRALLCLPMTGLFMIRLQDLAKPIPVAIVGRSSHGPVSAQQDMGVKPRNRTGTSVCGICRIITSSGSVIVPRSFSGLIIFANISSTVTRGQAGNGPTCWKTHVCWKKSRLYRHRGGEQEFQGFMGSSVGISSVQWGRLESCTRSG